MLVKDMNYMVSNKRASISIEVSIVLSVILIIITMVITSMNVQKTDLYMQAAIEQSTEDIAVLCPFTRIGDELLNSILDDDDIGDNAKQAYNSLIELSNTFGNLSGYSVEDLVMNGFLSEYLRNDIAYEFQSRSGNTNLYTPSTIDVSVDYNSSQQVLEVLVNYSISTLFGNIEKTQYSVIPFYGVYNNELVSFDVATEVGKEDINPWELNNFERGGYFGDLYGANLPKTFPVIDSFHNGCAVSIVSIDLTKDTYSSSGNIENKAKEKLDAIGGFNGADVTISGEQYVIDSSDIKDKQLIIIIPENTPEDRCKILTNYVDCYSNEDFNVTIIRTGESF